MQVVSIWTGRHATALRTALRLTNEAFAQTLGTATRTVAKWNAQPDLVPVPELQRTLDTSLQRASDEAKARFSSLVGGDAGITAELRLVDDLAVSQALAWLDEHAGWPAGDARRRVAQLVTNVDPRQLQDRANRRGRVGQAMIADALASYYDVGVPGYRPYRASCAGERVPTSVLSRSDWLDLRLPLGAGRDRLALNWALPEVANTLDEVSADAAAIRLAAALAAGTRIVNTPLYRLLEINPSGSDLTGTVAMTDFISYALTMDLLENELIDALAEGKPVHPGSLTLRDRYLPSVEGALNITERLCAGGVLALFAAARPAGGARKRPDYVLLVQERSGRVLNAAGRLAVIPKSFHEPLVDFAEDAQLAATLGREMEEELFRRPEVDSTNAAHKPAEPLHLDRLSPPMRWLVDHTAAWRMECTGFGLNLVSGNFEFAALIVINDETWWREFAGHIEPNWESDGLRRYSTLDTAGLTHLIHNPSWSNEGLFAFLQGARRLAEIGGERVHMPSIELET